MAIAVDGPDAPPASAVRDRPLTEGGVLERLRGAGESRHEANIRAVILETLRLHAEVEAFPENFSRDFLAALDEEETHSAEGVMGNTE